MATFLGEQPVEDLTGTPFENYGPAEWALYFVAEFGYIDGDHHKQWVLSSVARALLGVPVLVRHATWDNGESEYRVSFGPDPDGGFEDWAGDDWDEGVPP